MQKKGKINLDEIDLENIKIGKQILNRLKFR